MSGILPMPGAWDSAWDSPTEIAPSSDVPVPPSSGPRPSGSTRQRPSGVPSPSSTPSREVPRQPRAQNPFRRPTREVPAARASGGEEIKRPIVVAVFGQAGTGKTSFIKAVTGMDLEVGHNLASCTDAVLQVPCTIENENVVLVDTPGFSDTHLSDTEILRMIAEWMKDTYDEGFLLSGIIYLHRIIDVRMEGPNLKNLRMMKQLCGADSLQNVVLATTMWEKVTIEEGLRREAELEQTYWKDLIDGGATVARITTQSGNEAQSLVKSLLKNTPTSTRLQDELNSGLTLVQTAAGIEIREEMAKLEQKLKAEHQVEIEELRIAQDNRKKCISITYPNDAS
ncbi:uncharacterized protein K444DRAFT_571192 [Hyaloscypha bicolor E]|uniref:G domain-containing protein n=1 Tax=Hyaloscypha bicolor E TaxID=1095630 RepID=A0A2J6SSF3_9HELO|nr:uncharacterized protein K444DRAFT_571192 [Hyaloscypha bicolor E]PMD53669.1 hypothetical protein K444DRAFT_571192 [Hyaloscypha bicolor E]